MLEAKQEVEENGNAEGIISRMLMNIYTKLYIVYIYLHARYIWTSCKIVRIL